LAKTSSEGFAVAPVRDACLLMADVRTWVMFAYNDSDDDNDERRAIPEWRLEDAFRWARFRGYENVYFHLDGETTFQKAPSSGVQAGHPPCS